MTRVGYAVLWIGLAAFVVVGAELGTLRPSSEVALPADVAAAAQAGSNQVAAVQEVLLASNEQARAAAVTNLVAYSNHVREVYLRGVEVTDGVWEIYVGD